MFPLFYGFIGVHFKLFIRLLILILHCSIFCAHTSTRCRRRYTNLPSSWRALFTCHWPDKLLITSPRIFTSLLQVQVTSSVPLRTGRAVCSVPRTYSTSGDRSFAAAGTRVWNSLSSNLRDEKTQFSQLQTPAENSLVYC